MSGTTFPMSTIKTARPSSTTVWLHLLWKEVRQLWQLVIGVSAIGACLQLMLGLMEQLFSMDMRGLSHGAVNVALASPTLLAIGCSGILIGQERQTGSWTWSSSLPVSWRQSLLSKVVAWLVASACTVGILLIVAAVILPLNHSSLSLQLFSSRSEPTSWTQIVTVLIGIQVFVYLSIATLLFKDTLLAIVIAGFGLFAFHCIVVVSQISSIRGAPSGSQQVFNHENVVLLAYFASYIVGAIGFAVTYRWRWGTGQYTSLSLLGRFSRNLATPQRAAWQSFAKKALQPSEFSMLLQHGLRTSFWLRAITFISALLAIVSQGVDVPALMFLAFPAAFLASCILGVSVFSGEHTLNRYRFFADRGVDWRKLVATHMAFPALLTSLLMVAAAFLPTDTGEYWICVYCIPMFVVGMFSALVFPSPIISITVAISVLIGSFAFSSFAITIWRFVAMNGGIAIEYWIAVSTLIVIVTAIRQVPNWLTKDRFKATGLYFGTMLIAGLLPSVLGLSLGFLMLPNVAWEGMPYPIKPIDWNGGPDLTHMYNGIEIDPAYLVLSGNVESTLKPHFSRNVSDLSQNIQRSIKQKDKDFDLKYWLSSNMELIEAIERGGSRPIFEYSEINKLDKLIQGSAVIAMMATKHQEWGLAIRAWKANHKLLAFCNQPALQPATLSSRCFVWMIWYSLSDPDVRFLDDTGELDEMLPPAGPSQEQFREVLRARATLHRKTQRINAIDVSQGYFSYSHRWDGGNPLSVYPPLRWACERQHAMALSEDLSLRDFLPMRSRYNDPLVPQYKLLVALQNHFAGRLSNMRDARRGNTEPTQTN